MTDESDAALSQLKAQARRELASEARYNLRLELELFAFYRRETSAITGKMRAEMDPEDDRAERYFERRVLYSHVIYLASLLETYLKRACARLEGTRPLAEADDAKNGRFRLNEIAGDKWDQPKRFLEVYLRFDFPHCWSTLRSLADVRNFLVHDNGTLESVEFGKKREAKKTSFENLGLALDGVELVVTDNFIDSTLSAFGRLIEAIEHRLHAELTRAERPHVVAP